MHKFLQHKKYGKTMEIFTPLVISAVVVLGTLMYTSYLDLRDRRVPFVHWMPMIAVGICCTGYLLWEMSGNASLVTGYLTLVGSFLYADYLDYRGRKDSLCLAGYYRKQNIWPFLALVLLLPALSWFVLVPSIRFEIIPWYALFAGIFLYVSWLEYQGKFEEAFTAKARKRKDQTTETIGRWYFVLIILVLAITAVLMLASPSGWGSPAIMILFLAVFCGVFYTFGRMNLFGGADAWALIFIACAVPVFPFEPLLGTPPLGFLAFTVLINALILNLAAPLVIFAINLSRGNHAPLMYQFFGFPVSGDSVAREWGFVMEEFEEKEGRVTRRFIGFRDAIRRMYAGEGRIYTKDLREHPEQYARELALYRNAGTVWISYAVPFIIPITAGFVTAVLFGDILLALMNLIL